MTALDTEHVMYPMPHAPLHFARMSALSSEVAAIEKLDILDGRSIKDLKRVFKCLATWHMRSAADKKSLNEAWKKRDQDRADYQGEINGSGEQQSNLANSCERLRTEFHTLQELGATAGFESIENRYEDVKIGVYMLESVAQDKVEPKYQNQLAARLLRMQPQSTPTQS